MGDVIQLPNQGEVIADFRAIFTKMSVDRKGNLVLTFIVDMNNKYEAIKVTDFPHMLLRMTARREVVVYTDAIIQELKTLIGDPFEGEE